jgi:hypothetical protein
MPKAKGLNAARFATILFLSVFIKFSLLPLSFSLFAMAGNNASSSAAACPCSLRWSWSLGASFVQLLFDEPRFNLLACPRCFAQKRKTGLYARIELKTPDGDATPHLAPTMPLDKLIENLLQRDAVQGIAGMDGR